jgi:PKD repeat protein
VSEVGGTVSGSHSYADNGTFAVTVTVTDDEGGSGSDSLTVVVANVPPTVEAGPDQFLGSVGTTTLDATFSDPGTADTHTAVVDWGDGVFEQVTPVEGSHQYTSPGIYTVTVSVTDDDGGVGVDTLAVKIPAATVWGLVALAAGLVLLASVYAARRRSGA